MTARPMPPPLADLPARPARAVLAVLAAAAALSAVPARAASPAVDVALFFSPSCPHCHRLMTGFLPPLQSTYGERLRITYIDVSTPRGQALFSAAVTEYGVAPDRQGVPMAVVGRQALTGEDEIPSRLPTLVQQLLAAGGAPLPAFLGLTPPPPSAAPTAAAPAGFPRLPRSPASVAILGALLAALVLQLAHAALTWRRRRPARARPARAWATLALVVASLGVAVYLASAALRGGHVICLSDCDAVHSSEWAWLFGVVPVGVLGVVGAAGLLVAWLLGRHRDARVAARAQAAFLAMALLGVAFSVYLTFLELFVIGAMCEWCVANAVMMAVIAGLSLAPGKRALDAAFG